MGKCSKCGKNIRYNRYKIINDIIFCTKCAISVKIQEIVTPKQEIDSILKGFALTIIENDKENEECKGKD